MISRTVSHRNPVRAVTHPGSARPASIRHATTAGTDTPFVKELETPYSAHGASTTVATPSCCCCCCCVTALIVPAAALGFDTHSVAIKKGREGVGPGVWAALALPVPVATGVALFTSSAAIDLRNSVDQTILSWSVFLLWFVVTGGWIAAARRMAGQSSRRALAWGVFAPLIWLFLMGINFIIDIPLWFATVGIGAIVEVLLLPIWITLIYRGIRNQRRREMAPERPAYDAPPPLSGLPRPSLGTPAVPPPPPAPSEWDRPPHDR